jgi:predicted Zn-dependent peptidase
LRSRNRLLANHYAELQTLDRRADLISELTTYFDDPWRVVTELDRYRIVTPASVQQAAARWLDPSSRVVVTVVPEAK